MVKSSGKEQVPVEPMTVHLKRIVVGIVGGLVLFAGIAMIILPGPAIVVIPAGLAILATEFEWAAKLLRRMKAYIRRKRMNWKK